MTPEHWRRAEESVLPLVERGLLRVDLDGSVWRVAQERRRPKSGGTVVIPCVERRAEHDTGSYLQVRVMVDGVRHHAMAHRLVWRWFRGEIPEGLTVNHLDGVKSHNALANLDLATPSEQMVHAHATGLADQRGERNHRARLTDADVAIVHELRRQGQTQAAIAERMGVSYQHISKIDRGERRESDGRTWDEYPA